MKRGKINKYDSTLLCKERTTVSTLTNHNAHIVGYLHHVVRSTLAPLHSTLSTPRRSDSERARIFICLTRRDREENRRTTKRKGGHRLTLKETKLKFLKDLVHKMGCLFSKEDKQKSRAAKYEVQVRD